MSDQKICPTCGTEYPLSERFCPRDGTALRSGNAQADLLGSVVADRYHILKKLGEGGMGTVYLAEHVKMGRKSALKVMNPGMNTDADAIARFNREASNASRLSHPNICGIYDFGETPDGLIYLAMEYIEGSSLSGLIEKTGSMPPARSGSIIHQTADALQVAHDAGIVHRDLKPDNIMVARNRDGTDLVKVVDFGIAKASSSDAQKVTKTGLVVGTPEYMSPEQLAGDTLDGRSDIYSLGLVAFNCLTGKLPFPAETATEAMIMRLTDRPRTLAESRPDIVWTDELQRTMDKVLQRDAADRYQSASQFGREFAAAISAMPATQAVEAGTLVMGAASVGAAKDLPRTRIDRPSGGATVPMAAVPAPQRGAKSAMGVGAPVVAQKSKMPMIAGGGGLLAVAAVAAFLWLKPPADSGTVLPGPGVSGATTPTDSGADADTVKMVVNSPPSTPPPATREPAPAPTAELDDENETNAGTLAARIADFRDKLENGVLSEDEARKVILRMQQVRRNRRAALTPLHIADSWYVEMVAEGSLDNDTGVCRTARQVLLLHSSEQRRTAATTLMEGRGCS